jgi:hypothetical protein
LQQRRFPRQEERLPALLSFNGAKGPHMSICSGCHAGCCRQFAIPLTGADILQIARFTQLDFWSFVCRWADPYGLVAGNFAPHFRFVDEPQMPFCICLLRVDSQFHAGTGKCVFLQEAEPTAEDPLGTATCGIYGCRPSACRVFPTRLDATGELVVIDNDRACGKTRNAPVLALCPRPWQRSDLDPIDQCQALVVARHEMRFFHQVAACWNENPGCFSDFPEFLQLVYSERVRTMETTGAVAAPGVECLRLVA